MAIDVVFVCCWTCPRWGASTHPFISKGGLGYKKGNRVGYNMIPIKTLSLLAYFIYIFIDISIYAFGSMSWSSQIFWMVGRVIVDPSLGLLSPCGVVPRVPILITPISSIFKSPNIIDGRLIMLLFNDSKM
jgi:hypothetical protein